MINDRWIVSRIMRSARRFHQKKIKAFQLLPFANVKRSIFAER